MILTTLFATSALCAMQQEFFDAVKSGNLELIQRLIEQHADVNAQNTDARTPLIHVACYGHTHIAQLLIASQADVNAQSHCGWTPLSRAVYHRYADMVRALLHARSDLTLKTTSGYTALQIAQNGHRPEITQMIEQEARILNEGAQLRTTALALCAIRAHESTSILSVIPNELLFLILEQMAPEGCKRLLKQDQEY